MKPLLLIAFSLLAATTLNAQFSLIPQLGIEQSKTSLNYGSGATAAVVNGNLKAALKMDYNIKGHTPFINLTTAPAPVNFVFDNSGALINSFQSSALKFRIEAGYQFTSKAIQLGKQSAAKASATSSTSSNKQGRCGMRARCAQARANKFSNQTKALNMRLQPAIAFAYVPSATNSITNTADGINYKTAAYKTAVVPSMGFEFAKGRTPIFSLNVFYTKPLTQSSTSTMIGTGSKTFSLPLQTTASSWGLMLGIPIGFSHAPHKQTRMQSQTIERKECHRSYHRCGSFQLN